MVRAKQLMVFWRRLNKLMNGSGLSVISALEDVSKNEDLGDFPGVLLADMKDRGTTFSEALAKCHDGCLFSDAEISMIVTGEKSDCIDPTVALISVGRVSTTGLALFSFWWSLGALTQEGGLPLDMALLHAGNLFDHKMWPKIQAVYNALVMDRLSFSEALKITPLFAEEEIDLIARGESGDEDDFLNAIASVVCRSAPNAW